MNAQFNPPSEMLAFAEDVDGEAFIEGLFSEPLPEVVEVLSTNKSESAVWANLPDAPARLAHLK